MEVFVLTGVPFGSRKTYVLAVVSTEEEAIRQCREYERHGYDELDYDKYFVE